MHEPQEAREQESRTCTLCGTDKPVTAFGFRSLATGTRQSWCRSCAAARIAERRRAQRETAQQRNAAQHMNASETMESVDEQEASGGFWSPYFYGNEQRRMNTPVVTDGVVGRKCATCRRILSLEQFTQAPRWRDGYNPRCRDCLAAAGRSKNGVGYEPVPQSQDTGTVQVVSGVVTTHAAAVASATAVVPTAPDTALAAPRHTLEQWILEPPACPVSVFITTEYCIVRVATAAASQEVAYYLLRPPTHAAAQPQTPLDEGWLVALLEMLTPAPSGWVYGKAPTGTRG